METLQHNYTFWVLLMKMFKNTLRPMSIIGLENTRKETDFEIKCLGLRENEK